METVGGVGISDYELVVICEKARKKFFNDETTEAEFRDFINKQIECIEFEFLKEKYKVFITDSISNKKYYKEKIYLDNRFEKVDMSDISLTEAKEIMKSGN